MDLFLLGVSHHTAPVDLRERVDFPKRGLVEALGELAKGPAPAEAVVLTTCNRAEIYVSCEDAESTHTELSEFMSQFHGVPTGELTPHLYARQGKEVARHLFRVAAGLDSLVVGEPQIFGQVKDAYAIAARQGSTGILLNKLFPWSFNVGKRIRAETGLGEGAVSVSYAALSLARKIFGKLDNRAVLVVGAGEMAELTATHLQAQQVKRIAVASRTFARANALANRVDGTAVEWSEIDTQLVDADIVVTATGATTPILTGPAIERVMHARRNRPLFIIDLGLPRDVDPSAAELEQVFLYNIADLRAIVSENLARRQEQTTQAETLVATATEEFLTWMHARGTIPTVVALRRRFEEVRQSEIKRLEPKLNGLTPEARARVEEVTRLLVQKLLLPPTERLKAASDATVATQYAEAVTELFQLGEESDANDSGGTEQNPEHDP